MMLTIALGSWGPANAGPRSHAETVCPPPALLAQMPSDSTLDVPTSQLTGTPLWPGQRVRTRGTNLTESQELSNQILGHSLQQAFTVSTVRGDVKGTLTQKIKQGHDGFCKCEWTISLAEDSAGCVIELQIDNFQYPAGLAIVADFRDDLGGNHAIPSKSASRPTRSQFRFRLPDKVCPGQNSRPLLLNTLIRRMANVGIARVVAEGGKQSEDLETFAPHD
ncbi:MAG TPA: hypothetical protein VFY73_30060 [Ideonella sp.]|uniref:hypothetical protein n=1 Tax=Ideonella sp. TaxID=1929293 RepID=UPI002E31FA4E|nr:hypothetical protein [Ideonella sp.]HEX5688285.1 hypothetical protein [Ideonella sp.]